MDERVNRLYQWPEVIEVDRSEVRPGILGEVHFDSGKIFVPGFRKALNSLSIRAREAYRPLADALKGYIRDHEISELYSRPGSEEEHARMDAYIIENNPSGWIGYVLHGLRNMYGNSEQRRFSEIVSRYSPVMSTYRAINDRYPDVVEGVKKLLGLKPFDPEELGFSPFRWAKDYARAGISSYIARLGEAFMPGHAYRSAIAGVEV